MPQVEDVAGSALRLPQHIHGPFLPELVRAVQRGGVQVALYSEVVAYALPRHVERYAPVHPDGGPAVGLHQVEQGSGVRAEVNEWETSLPQVAQEAL